MRWRRPPWPRPNACSSPCTRGDIDGAHRAGLRTAWVNRSGGPYPDHLSRADIEVASITDLAKQLAVLPTGAH
jgi:hypothetical protein